MALVPPSISALSNLRAEEESILDDEGAELHLQIATDLMEIATNLHTMPDEGTLAYRVLTHGILDMAWYIGTSMEDRDAQFSPFSSERIGSYSYSKAQRSIQLGQITGVPLFDVAVSYFSGLLSAEESWTHSTSVMPETLHDNLRHPDKIPGEEVNVWFKG